MPRRRGTAPAYQFHISGQAKVRLNYRDYYLGPHGSPESYARYHALLGIYNANGQTVPADMPTHQLDDLITVRCITADYRTERLPIVAHNIGDHGWQSNMLDLLDAKFGDLPVDDFGPRALATLRRELVNRGNARSYANKQTRFVVRVFKFGVSRELVTAATVTALSCLEPLRRGEAREGKAEQAASIADVDAAKPYLCSCVRAMVDVQLATGMRPTEVMAMRPMDIDRSGAVWIYRPADHKTAHYGIDRAVPLLGDAIAAIEPYLSRDAAELLFKTSKSSPWNKNSYRRHIARACEQAGVHWTPRQLRRTAAQKVRDELGPEHAQALLGHRWISTTEIYAKANQEKAIEAAKILSVC